MLIVLLLVPTIAGLLAFFIQSDRGRHTLLVAAAVTHSLVTASFWLNGERPELLWRWLALDDMGLLFLSIVSALFLASACYATGYLNREKHEKHLDLREGFLFTNEPEQVFTGCMLLFLASMSAVTLSQHMGLLWVNVEATTLVSAPMIYFHRHHRSLEATWKYLLICSVGIALALLGNFLLAVSASGQVLPDGEQIDFTTFALLERAEFLDKQWLSVGFLFLLIGYGTKMGLAPMHTWLPDAHSEAPSAVSALLSGALLNCAFLGILRVHQICVKAGEAEFSQNLLVGFGLASMGVAAIFLLGQADFKRMLAYSSVEHMGILSLGMGLGGLGVFGSLLHAVNHSVTKAALFLIAGNVITAYRTKSVSDVHSMLRTIPVSGVLWVMGFLSITGSPPFGPFLSEFTILKAALDQAHPAIAIAYLAILGLIFIGMCTIVLQMVQPNGSRPAAEPLGPEPLSAIVPPAVLCILMLVLGLYVPPELTNMLQTIAKTLGGT